MLPNRKKWYLVGFKLVFASLAITAIVTELVVLVQREAFHPGNFFSYFTIQSNAIAATVLIVSAVLLMRQKMPKYLAGLRGATTLYMLTTGIVFAVLLSGLDPTVLTAVPWDNLVLHYIVPAAILIDYLFDPPHSQLSFKKALLWLLYPFVYIVYSLVRGSITGWYPYPFLNPSHKGYLGIIVTACSITMVLVLLTTVVVWYSRFRFRSPQK